MKGQLKYWVALNAVPDLTATKLKQLRQTYGSAQAVWETDPAKIPLNSRLKQADMDALRDFRKQTTPEDELQKVLDLGARAVSIDCPDYPEQLLNIADPPTVLYYRGALPAKDERIVAVVGTRHATSYGTEICRRICADLAKTVTIISGLAYGVDAIAHKATVDAKGRTVAVIANGIDTINPKGNTALARAIVGNGGSVLTEYPPHTEPRSHHFPQRNRIVSGIAAGVLIVEAGDHSGALITANLALQQNREVFAVPGNITSRMSRGTNALIKDGACLVREASDILKELGWDTPPDNKKSANSTYFALAENELQTLILKTIANNSTPMDIDQIVATTDQPVQAVIAELGMLEINGVVQNMNGSYSIKGQS